MEKLLGTWKMKYMLLGSKKSDVSNDREFANMRFMFEDGGKVYECILIDHEPTKDELEFAKSKNMKIVGNLLITKEHSWKIVDEVLVSDISQYAKSDSELTEFGKMEFVDDYLKIGALFAEYLLEKC